MFCLCPCHEYCLYLPRGSRRGKGKGIWRSSPEDPQLVRWDWFQNFVGPASDWGAHCFVWLHLFLWFCRSDLLGEWLRRSNDCGSPFLSKDGWHPRLSSDRHMCGGMCMPTHMLKHSTYHASGKYCSVSHYVDGPQCHTVNHFALASFRFFLVLSLH